MLSVEDEKSNLVELAVYGIASLYERFTPKTPPEAAKPAPPSADKTPGAKK